MKKRGIIGRLMQIVGLLLFIAVVGSVCFIIGITYTNKEKESLPEPEPVITADLLKEQVDGISHLATAEYNYTNMGQFENQMDFYGWSVPFTRKSFIVSYDGKLTAGIDLSDMDIRVNGYTITFHLPTAKILYHEIDEASLQVYDETNSIFNPISLEDYSQFALDQKASVEEDALKKGILQEARGKAEEVLTKLVDALSAGNPEESYRVTFVYDGA